MATRISKTYRGGSHVGWKKTVGGKEWFLGYGISAADEAKAKTLAEVLEAKWKLAQVAGHSGLSETDFEDAKALVANRPSWKSARREVAALIPVVEQPVIFTQQSSIPINSAPIGIGRRWLFASIDEFAATTKRLLKHDLSNGDHIINTIERVIRARDAIEDILLDGLRLKEIDDWLAGLRHLKSRQTGKPLSATTIRNLATAVKAALNKFAKWEWWRPPPDWRDSFKEYTIKKLETPNERTKRRKRPPIYSVAEKRLLWHLALDFGRAMMALAEWAGHTQKEIAPLTFPDIQDDGKDMYIDRDRPASANDGRRRSRHNVRIDGL